MKLLTLMTSYTLMTSLMTKTLTRGGNDVIIDSCPAADTVSDTQTFAVDSQRLRAIRVWHGLKVRLITVYTR